jgi:transcriptional regulator with XRE-family HTH domain
MPTGRTDWAAEGARLGRELRRHRQQAGLTQRQLAAAVPMNHSYLHKIEAGQASQASARYWLPLAIQAAIEARVQWEASLRISALELQDRVDDIVARHVSEKLGRAR